MVEAVAEDGEMSVYVRRGAGKSYSDEGSLFFLEVVGVVLWACFSHCAPQVVGILEGGRSLYGQFSAILGWMRTL